jgi:DNA-binding transcriptional LysR family regulator
MSVPGAPWITQAGTLHQRPFWADEPATGTSPEDATLRRVLVDSAETLLCCVRSGLGQCRLPMGVGMREPLLVRVETGHPEWLQDLEQVSQPELAGSPRLAACSAWLKDCLDRFNRY